MTQLLSDTFKSDFKILCPATEKCANSCWWVDFLVKLAKSRSKDHHQLIRPSLYLLDSLLQETDEVPEGMKSFSYKI